MTKIKTTHVGSLPRSNELSDLLFKKDKKEKIDTDNFDAVVKKDGTSFEKTCQISFIQEKSTKI